jgi:hypothetical protein
MARWRTRREVKASRKAAEEATPQQRTEEAAGAA